MRRTNRLFSSAALGLSAALLLMLTACGEPAEEQQEGSVAPSDAPAASATTEPAEDTTASQ